MEESLVHVKPPELFESENWKAFIVLTDRRTTPIFVKSSREVILCCCCYGGDDDGIDHSCNDLGVEVFPRLHPLGGSHLLERQLRTLFQRVLRKFVMAVSLNLIHSGALVEKRKVDFLKEDLS